jgi:hypothetical protein
MAWSRSPETPDGRRAGSGPRPPSARTGWCQHFPAADGWRVNLLVSRVGAETVEMLLTEWVRSRREQAS